MTTILPEKNKKNIKKDYQTRFFSRFIRSLIFASLVWLVLEGTLFYIINSEISELGKKYEEQDQSEKNKLINVYKKDLSGVSDLVNVFDISDKSKTEILDFIFSAKTDQININSVSIETGGSAVYVGINGNADNREALLFFNKELENNKKTEQVELPISSFTRTFEVPFSITFIYNHEQVN